MRIRSAVIGCGVLVLASLPAFAQRVSVDHDKSTDFGKYGTYAWKEGTPVPSPLTHQRIIHAIDYHLSMRGFEKVDEDPDMYVTYHASAKEEVNITDWGHGGPRWNWSSNVSVQKILVGVVVVDLIDAGDGKLFWRAVASDTVSEQPQKNERKINKAAEKMFAKFPPQSQ